MPHWGDLDRPPLLAREAARAMPWRAVQVVAQTGSTNADLVERALAGEPEGLVLVADHQTAGRGRQDRVWTAPPRAGLAVSVLLRPTGVPVQRWTWLTLLAGVSLTEVLVRFCGLPAVLKWPNDVLVAGRTADRGQRPDVPRFEKVAGVLAEVVPGPAGVAVVLGFGLNVSQDRDELPVPAATSLQLAGSAVTDRLPVLRAVLRRLADDYAAWTAAGGEPRGSGLGARYRERCQTIGEHVRVQLPDGGLREGLAEGIDDDGRLLVADRDGVVQALAAGDVTHVRAAERA